MSFDFQLFTSEDSLIYLQNLSPNILRQKKKDSKYTCHVYKLVSLKKTRKNNFLLEIRYHPQQHNNDLRTRKFVAFVRLFGYFVRNLEEEERKKQWEKGGEREK